MDCRSTSPKTSFRRLFSLLVLAPTALGAGGCGSGGTVALPPPRPIVVFSGERLRVDPARMDTIYQWLQAESQNIEQDPTFLIDGVAAARETLPWETLSIEGDTARVQYDRAHPDILNAYHLYAHLHLMKRMGRLDEWLPDHAEAEGYELERAIVERLADTWLIGRAIFDAPAYGPLDELIYAREAGYLDAYLLVARAEEFPDERAEWERAEPGRLEEYRAWFRGTFDREPPGL